MAELVTNAYQACQADRTIRLCRVQPITLALEYIKARKHERRARLIAMLGGCCARCGSTDDLEFDHIDPSTKRFNVCADLTRAWDELVEEASRCQLLCKEDHIAKSAEDRPEPAHSRYRYLYWGCRCAICRAANAAASARQRRRRLQSVGIAWDDHGPASQKSWSQLPRPDSNGEPAG